MLKDPQSRTEIHPWLYNLGNVLFAIGFLAEAGGVVALITERISVSEAGPVAGVGIVSALLGLVAGHFSRI